MAATGTVGSSGNYLRVRGEYSGYTEIEQTAVELPPRARRIHWGRNYRRYRGGTTSACAENTCGLVAPSPSNGNYLRVRGEYYSSSTCRLILSELPPRARRILQETKGLGMGTGTTSACAENTRRRRLNPPCAWNYLRVRGEYMVRKIRVCVRLELPPRARRILGNAFHPLYIRGTTSACAENTCAFSSFAANIRNYLRVRGEYR